MKFNAYPPNMELLYSILVRWSFNLWTPPVPCYLDDALTWWGSFSISQSHSEAHMIYVPILCKCKELNIHKMYGTPSLYYAKINCTLSLTCSNFYPPKQITVRLISLPYRSTSCMCRQLKVFTKLNLTSFDNYSLTCHSQDFHLTTLFWTLLTCQYPS